VETPESLVTLGPSPTSSPTPGRLGRYELVGILGKGGMGVVWRARDPELRRDAALKVMPALADEELRERFRRETRAAARLDHPNIIRVHDIGECEDGRPYLVMAIAADTLAARRRELAGQWHAIAALVEGIARGVHHAHDAGVVHRDLKPTNVLLDAEGRPLVADFGVARLAGDGPTLTQTGQALGTPANMAPEQADGTEVGPAADVWSLGVVLYELLAGRRPFEGSNAALVVAAVQAANPGLPSRHVPGIPRALETVCLKCLEKDPRRRYASAGELADDLRRFLDGDRVLARGPRRLVSL
jgi:serine/threonine-protein kinase